MDVRYIDLLNNIKTSIRLDTADTQYLRIGTFRGIILIWEKKITAE